MLICSMIVLFALASFVGWVFESLLAIVKTKKWESRGFLYGPVCPIYGVAVVLIVLVVKAVVRYAGLGFEWVHVAAFAFFGSMALEYVTSWGLEKLFNAYWWDYSDMPLNINGRTCIPAACLFCAAGVFTVYVVSPAWDYAVSLLPAIVVEIIAFVLVILFTVDFTLTISALSSFQAQVIHAEEQFNERAEALTDKLTSLGPNAAERARAEREKLRELSMQEFVNGMSMSARSALGRVKGFRLPVRPSRPNLPDPSGLRDRYDLPDLREWMTSIVDRARNFKRTK